jgi:hypothetical protein
VKSQVSRLSKAAHISAEFAELSGDAFVTPEDIEALGFAAVATLANWRSKHIGPPSVLVAGGIRYRVDDVRAWIATGGVRGPLHRRQAAA